MKTYLQQLVLNSIRNIILEYDWLKMVTILKSVNPEDQNLKVQDKTSDHRVNANKMIVMQM